VIKAIIFDFFGVLVTEGFKQFCDTHFSNDDKKRQEAIKLVNKHDSGLISMEEFYAGLASLAHIEYSSAEAINSNQPNSLLINYIRQELKSKYKIGVLSNSGDDYISRMLDSKDVKMFDDIILSFRHGMIKPQKEIFEMSAERLGIETSECIFVDDSLSHCAGARAAGMQAILYREFRQMKTDLEKLLSTGSDN